VPKPHTPFQWCRVDSLEATERKQRLLAGLCRRYRLTFKHHDARTSILEAVLSRADRRLGKVIERAWRNGCRFDGWTEHFNYGRWMEAFADEGIDTALYLRELPVRTGYAPQSPLVPLPWDHLDTLVEKEFQARELSKALKGKLSPPCGLPVKILDGRPTAIAPSDAEFDRVRSRPLLCYNCGLDCNLTVMRDQLERARRMHVESDEALASLRVSAGHSNDIRAQDTGSADLGEPAASATLKLFAYRAAYTKTDSARYLSHLDLARTLPRAFRRADIRLGYSVGYHPMPLLSYGPALSVGVAGDAEWIDFSARDDLEPALMLERLNAVLPDGLRFLAIRRLPPDAPALTRAINRAEYSILLDEPELQNAVRRLASVCDDFAGMDHFTVHRRLVEEFFEKDSVVVQRVRNGQAKLVDIRQYAKSFCLRGSNGSSELALTLAVTNAGSARFDEVLKSIYRLDEDAQRSVANRVRRRRLFVWRDGVEMNPFEAVGS
jgi:radical SAM-linked protein